MPGAVEATVVGDRELQLALKEIADDMVDKIAPAGIRGYLRVVTKGIKAEVPPNMKDLKKAIGWRFVKFDKRSRKTIAKAGPAIGVKRGKLMSNLQERANRPGVGISINNYMWYITGTKQRKQNTTNRRTGAAKPHPIVKDGYRSSRSAAIAKFRELAKKDMDRRAKRIRAKARRGISKKVIGI